MDLVLGHGRPAGLWCAVREPGFEVLEPGVGGEQGSDGSQLGVTAEAGVVDQLGAQPGHGPASHGPGQKPVQRITGRLGLLGQDVVDALPHGLKLRVEGVERDCGQPALAGSSTRPRVLARR
ncbi:hypothetical protein [Streptomyces sp. NPDC007206]|uniref:hypothetical protein n=1 Tax=Streptomyces sp. NPDC007206 TaxID=3154317 RepID=UPI0033EE0FAB